MPRFDGRGPFGFGPGAGRGLGPCGRSMGWRTGRDCDWGFGRRITKKEETELLEDELKNIKERLAELKAQK